MSVYEDERPFDYPGSSQGDVVVEAINACTYENRESLGSNERKCHDYEGGSMILCDECYAQASEDYPQGWRGYPGDTCRHGKYTGGCGIDWMCGPCEMGEE